MQNKHKYDRRVKNECIMCARNEFALWETNDEEIVEKKQAILFPVLDEKQVGKT